MNAKKFAELSLEYFGPLLADYGFQHKRPEAPLYFRKNLKDIYHFVSPSINGDGMWFDLIVYAHSPQISDDFAERFEEGMDIPSGLRTFLSPDAGVSWHQKFYRCRTEEGFVRNFEREAKPALKEHGLPYLDSIQTLQDLVRTIAPEFVDHYNIPKEMQAKLVQQ